MPPRRSNPPTPRRSSRPAAAPGLRRLEVRLAFGTTSAGAPIADRPLGTIAEAGPRLYFEYHPTFIANPLPVSPLRAPVQAGLLEHPDADFDRLPGLLSDSAPDGWGRTVQDRAFAARGQDRRTLTIMDRLAAVGAAGMGALTFQPAEVLEGDRSDHADRWPLLLPDVAAQAVRLYDGSAEALLPTLRLGGGSPGGARPKVLAGLAERDDGRIELIAGVTPSMLLGRAPALPSDYVPYLIKFGAGEDVQRFGRDVGAVEHAYALMARAAGLDVPTTRLLEAQDGERHFACARFDRFGPGGIGRRHMHTAGGLLHASYRLPSLDYRQLLQLGLYLTRAMPTAVELLRRAAFNVFTHNRDDHARNFAFLMDEAGQWTCSPAYDLTYSDGINGHHTTSVADETEHPGRAALEKLGAEVDLPAAQVQAVIEQVIDQVGQWPAVARSLEIARPVIDSLEQVFTRLRTASAGPRVVVTAASTPRRR